MNKISEWFRNKSKVVKVAVAAVIVFALGAIIVGLGYYPVITEGNHFISRASFDKNYATASFYYYNVLRKTYLAETKEEDVLKPLDIEKTVLEQLVENSIIEREARLELGKDLQDLIQKKIATYGDDAKFRDVAKKLYGLSYDDFKNELLVPQAKKDALAAQFFLQGKNFEDWLSEAKKSAKVRVFLNGLRWQDGEAK